MPGIVPSRPPEITHKETIMSQNNPKQEVTGLTTSSRRQRSRRTVKTTFLSVALVLTVTTFYSIITTLTNSLPDFMTTLGMKDGSGFIASTITVGFVTGVYQLVAFFIERTMRTNTRPVWSPYGIRGTKNARRCKRYSKIRLSQSL